jgi:hypothetical protein
MAAGAGVRVMIRWALSQWALAGLSVISFFVGLTVAANIQMGLWPPQWAITGFILTCVSWVGVTILTYETRQARREVASPIHRVGGQ